MTEPGSALAGASTGSIGGFGLEIRHNIPGDGFGGRFLIHLEPPDAAERPEPRELPLGHPARVALDEPDGPGEVGCAGQMSQHLSVPE